MARMTHVEDLVVAVGEYPDPQTNEKRYRYMTIGRVFERENGSRVAKITCLPAGAEAAYWNGYVNLFPKRDQ